MAFPQSHEKVTWLSVGMDSLSTKMWWTQGKRSLRTKRTKTKNKFLFHGGLELASRLPSNVKAKSKCLQMPVFWLFWHWLLASGIPITNPSAQLVSLIHVLIKKSKTDHQGCPTSKQLEAACSVGHTSRDDMLWGPQVPKAKCWICTGAFSPPAALHVGPPNTHTFGSPAVGCPTVPWGPLVTSSPGTVVCAVLFGPAPYCLLGLSGSRSQRREGEP